jgi:hypothetical protein
MSSVKFSTLKWSALSGLALSLALIGGCAEEKATTETPPAAGTTTPAPADATTPPAATTTPAAEPTPPVEAPKTDAATPPPVDVKKD